ncbi:DNA-directed RNA polymerase III complex subunit Rpc25 [Coemansia thaxteri]|uniref:DNA-directed RNA polymerase III subunit RPC8 n=1 Tax=Coemansia thaxteri TaxID=2663907 RepID=A0A9W8EES7_9FUNG|nr:DNA-directed RNA polymerase III complex subunit Rpc25 [Coemansia thaxteri]KAJ2002307.1 DNA-directed RNA polymerase III complex subunit Rpc25 [Coemansia thaxteri]KAJ2481141.1 DNA-directed RNA polymerase III complex subunit Rpc25 [Coemansia sp. RSA 2320]
MFVLAVLRDTLKIIPSEFTKSREDALKDEINQKYTNRVLHDIGLCMMAHDLLEIDEGYVQHSEGCIWVKVKFRLVVFRPFKDEILVGRVRSANSEGVQVTMGFFDDITIPANQMPQGSEFDSTEGIWVWRFEGNELFMDLDEQVRFQVLDETFLDVSPPRPKIGDVGNVPVSHPPPYSLVCTIASPGLGLLSWWTE